MPTKVAIVEDSADICEELAHVLEGAREMACVCICRNSRTALDSIPAARPDVVIMDINLPDSSGIDCTSRLKRIMPEVKILMFTIHDNTEQIVRALEAGASGYLLKYTPAAEIIGAIRELQGSGAPLSQEVARKLVSTFHRPQQSPNMQALTPRECEILELLSRGLMYKEVAARLAIKMDTVGTHIKSIYRKLRVRSRTQAVIKYKR